MACTEEQALAIIDDLHSTETIKSVLKRHKVDTKSFYKMITTVPSLIENYLRAQSIRADLMADEVVHVSRTVSDANAARNQINALIWAASKMKPSVYGDRIDLNITQRVDGRAALEAAMARVREVVETTAKPLELTTGCEPVPDANGVKNEVDDLLK